MQPLSRPFFSVTDLINSCTSYNAHSSLSNRLKQERKTFDQSESEYIEAADKGELHTLQPHEDVSDRITKEEMKQLYNNRMADKNGSLRTFYEQIIIKPKHGRCPLCGQRQVSSLDHFLPKAHYPVFAITPVNLVPACLECNRKKLDESGHSAGKYLLHPYFDDVSQEQWLSATVVCEDPPAIQFRVRAPKNWSYEYQERAEYHMDILGLYELYSSNAAKELQNLKSSLKLLHSGGGREAVQEHLYQAALSRKDHSLNSWQTAMYEALAYDAWFCQSGIFSI